jgi:hypothetical protein
MKELTILMSCLDGMDIFGQCIRRARQLLSDNGIGL